jgi:transposase InsO family protein
MLRVLRRFEGFPTLSTSTLKELRKRNRFLHRRLAPDEDAKKQAYDHIRKTLESGQSAQWGSVYTHTHLRLNLDVFVTRDMVRDAIRAIDPVGVAFRTCMIRGRRYRYMVKGPNERWAVDGHDKLSAFGFQIYGIIDTFSRMVLGCYVGISNRTQVAVQKYYLDTVNKYGVPKSVRSDKGTETTLMATAHVALRRAQSGDELPFREAFIYGPSTSNIRIESWWNLLIDAQTESWKTLFEQLSNAGMWSKSKYDRIALRHLFMTPLREHIKTFVTVHNTHSIRRQSNRAHYLRYGKPDELYNYSDCPNFATAPVEPLFTDLKDQVEPFSIDAFETPQVAALCQSILLASGIEYDLTHLPPGLDQPHILAYDYLRQALAKHELDGNVIEELLPPKKGRTWMLLQKEKQETEFEARRQQGTCDDSLVGEVESGGEDENSDSDDDGILLNL